MQSGERLAAAIAAIDEFNAQDPSGGELEYSRRMTAMLERFAPGSPEQLQLAARAQHIGRWKTPRGGYPEGKQGYLAWRGFLYRYHAETAGALLQGAGYDAATVARVKSIVAKQVLRADPQAQVLEDVAALVFLEHYLAGFAARHAGYEEAKFLDILRKTWRKTSPRAREFALAGGISVPPALLPLVRRAAGAA
jgi:hypothetical protein